MSGDRSFGTDGARRKTDSSTIAPQWGLIPPPGLRAQRLTSCAAPTYRQRTGQGASTFGRSPWVRWGWVWAQAGSPERRSREGMRGRSWASSNRSCSVTSRRGGLAKAWCTSSPPPACGRAQGCLQLAAPSAGGPAQPAHPTGRDAPPQRPSNSLNGPRPSFPCAQHRVPSTVAITSSSGPRGHRGSSPRTAGVSVSSLQPAAGLPAWPAPAPRPPPRDFP